MSARVGRLRIAYDLWKQYGTGNFSYRIFYALWRRTGMLKRRFATDNWNGRSLDAWLDADARATASTYQQFRDRSRVRFFFASNRLPEIPSEWTGEAIQTANQILTGRLAYFSSQTAELGFPFDWFLNPFTGVHAEATRHWCERNDFDAREGDIKFYWEPSRFGWVFPLVRAYAATRDEKYALAFWQLFESWREANPPNHGPNWQCGQECALRSLALCFALYGFGDSPATTSQRVAQLATMLAVHAVRIERNVRFAETQMNNHGLSEGVGLYTIGTLFPEFVASSRWREHGRTVIERAARLHSYADGSYIQHSFNYHRLMLHDYLWVTRLAELNSDSFSPALNETLDRHTRFLYQLQDQENGQVPNYGPNDGALILPLNGCAYLDYRPVIGAMHYQLHRERLYERGPWHEDLCWLFGAEAANASHVAPPRESQRFDIGGYYSLRGQETWGMVRCHTYRHHPHQADMLHLDVWWRGVNILRDSGTYSYNAPEPWCSYFSSTAAHNTVELGGESQMLKQRRFTWVHLTRSKLQHFAAFQEDDVDYFQGAHYGYQRLASRAVHRRAVLRIGERYWLVVDDVFGHGTEQMRLFWHLVDAPWKERGTGATLETTVGAVGLHLWADPLAKFGIVRGQDTPATQGWHSLHYGEKLPAPTAWIELNASLPQRLITLVSLGVVAEPRFERQQNRVHWEGRNSEGSGTVELAPLADGDGAVVRNLNFDGRLIDLDRPANTANQTRNT